MMNDGSVDIIMSDVYNMIAEITPEGEATGSFNVSVDQTGLTMVATGDDSKISYDINGPSIVMTLESVSIPGEAATLSAADTAAAAASVGLAAQEAESVAAALDAILARDPDCRVLICGSLYLAGIILSQNT